MRPQPANYIWRKVELIDGDGVARTAMAMVPTEPYRKVCARRFAEDMEQTLAPVSERTLASHNHYFAALKGYYDNLPEKIAARWTSPEHFRKYLLVELGWVNEKRIDVQSELHASRLKTFIRTNDETYMRISTVGKTVIIQTAKSQAFGAMDKETFEASKKDVLELAEQFVGVKPSTMIRETRRIAG